jgi:hypothetical protein
VDASKNDFEESGVGQGTLNELQQVSDDRPLFLLILPGDILAFLCARREEHQLRCGSEECNRETLLSAMVRSDHLSQTAGSQQPLSNRGSHSRQRQSGGSKIRPPGCPLLLHQRLKALCLRHNPTHSAALNRLQLVCKITWPCPLLIDCYTHDSSISIVKRHANMIIR